jgi:hypothetical protein
MLVPNADQFPEKAALYYTNGQQFGKMFRSKRKIQLLPCGKRGVLAAIDMGGVFGDG